jgi:hypothetical protein
MRKRFYALSAVGLAVNLTLALVWTPAIVLVIAVLALIALGIFDQRQVPHAVLRNFPVGGHGQYIMEWLRPMMYQYFIEPETDGAPINRMYRSVVYQRAKGDMDSTPLGTKLDTEAVGYEWMDHSLLALDASSLSDSAVRSERHRSYDEIWSRLRRMVVPFDGCAARYRPRPANPNKKGRSRTS